MAEVIVIDIWSVVPLLAKMGHKMTGTPVPGLVDYVQGEQAKGSTVFFCAGQAHDPFFRQLLERYLESIGIRAVFVIHGIPDGFTIFISANAFKFDGKNFPS
jgi:hypothetical protein